MKTIQCIFGFLFLFYSSFCEAQWAQVASYPGGVTNAAVGFSIGDTVYFGSGASGSTAFYKLDPSSGTWTKRSSLPLPSAAGVCFTIGSKGYVALGESNPTDADPLASVTNDLWEYDPTLDKWTPKSSLPGTPRFGAIAFVIGNKAYVGGGGDADGFVQNDFYSYDPTTDTWTTLQELPEYLCFWATFTIGDYGYLATGSEGNDELALVWRYNPSSDSWTQMSDFPGAQRQAAVGFALNGKGYVGLGEAQSDTVFSDFYSYDPTADQWMYVTSFPSAHGRADANAVATSSAAFIGLGAYYSGQNLFGNSDIWSFSATDGVASAMPSSDQNVYPNPASGFVNLSLPENISSAHIIVQNSIGATCFTTHVGSDGWLDLSSLPPGIYRIDISSVDYRSTERVVKM